MTQLQMCAHVVSAFVARTILNGHQLMTMKRRLNQSANCFDPKSGLSSTWIPIHFLFECLFFYRAKSNILPLILFILIKVIKTKKCVVDAKYLFKCNIYNLVEDMHLLRLLAMFIQKVISYMTNSLARFNNIFREQPKVLLLHSLLWKSTIGEMCIMMPK